MTPKTDTDTRYAARSGAGVPPAQAPEDLAHTGQDQRRAAVSWSHVLPLGVMLAFANGFWIVVLRGAVGAIERTSAPFSTWLQESTLLIPVYVAAVLLAFMLAQRWFGPRPRSPRAVGGTIATVAATASAAGTLLLGFSSWFDYRLQATDLEHMSAAHPGCDSSCLTARIHATVGLEIKALWIGLLLMLLTDLVLIALLLAFRGGVLVLARSPRAARSPRVDDSRLVLAAGLAGAAVIHAAIAPQYFDTWSKAGVFFVALALAQVAASAAVLVSARTKVLGLVAAAVVSAAPLAVWVMSRGDALPFQPAGWKPEWIGVAAVMAGVLELVTLGMALTLLRRGRSATPWNRHALAVALTGVLAGTVIGLAGASLPVVGAFDTLGKPPAHTAVIPQG